MIYVSFYFIDKLKAITYFTIKIKYTDVNIVIRLAPFFVHLTLVCPLMCVINLTWIY